MKISLITVTYNSEKTLSETFESVLKQKYKNYEHIIVDGLSKDKTMNIVKRYEKKYNDRLKYISEKDSGLYDAMNKGIKMASGDIIGILNSDDILANDLVFEKIVSTFENEKCDGTYSDLVFMNEETMSIPVRNFIAHKYSKHFGWHPPHPTLYLKKEVYDNVGTFNTDYRIAADLDFMMRMIKSGYKLSYIKEYLILMRSGGVSTNGLKGYLKNLKEANIVLKKNGIKCYYLINIFRIFKTFWQGISAKLFKNKISEVVYEKR